MRYRTAAILSVVLIVVTGGMFAIESVLKTTFIPPLHSDLPLSGFDRNLIAVALFCGLYKWLLALFTLAAVPVLVTIAVFTSDSKVGDAAGADATANWSATCSLESEGGSVLESAIFSSIRGICTRSKRRRDGAR